MKKSELFKISFVVLGSITIADAQTIYHAKLYNSMTYGVVNNLESSGKNTTIKTTQLLKLMPGFSITKGKSILEFVVSSFAFKNYYTTDTYPDSLKAMNNHTRVNSTSIGIQIIRYFHLMTSGNNRINYYLGANLEPLYSRQKSSPSGTNTFRTSLTTLSLNAYLAPRVSYKLNEKLNLELNIPINVFQLSNQINKVENPLFSTQQQTTQVFNFDSFASQIMVNVGIACKL